MIAAVHRRSALIAGGQVVGVLGSSQQRSREAAQAWGVADGYSSLEQLAASEAEVVHVCSPNATHAPYVQALLAAGKHVICEKPLGVTAAQAQEMTDLAARAGVVATVPFVYRYHPVVREIRARVQAGEFGDWNLLHGHYLQDWLRSAHASNWRVDPAQGGASRAFADIGSHWCDLVEWVSGQRIQELTAQLSIAIAERPDGGGATFGGRADGKTAAVSTEDIATVLFRTADRIPGSVVISQVAAGRKNRLWFELDGAGGSASFDQENPESFWLGSSEGSRCVVRDSASGSAEQRRLSYLPAGHAQGYGDCFAAFVADTYAAVRGEQPDGLPTFADGARSAVIVDAVVRSAREAAWTAVTP
ncbi:Gfo/Idh/MocA family protein [Angustibacter sp. McL0619]|uniref:Gfo/Idh/MocA family protein n=1 Tax=Angustibacter sp. McL0619 TaxID=3415676 RepID=UPI003CFA5058